MLNYIVLRKSPKEINDIHISITVSLITLRSILVNINELRDE